MSRGFVPMLLTVAASIGIYYYWSVVLEKNENTGLALGIIAAVLVSGIFARKKKRK